MRVDNQKLAAIRGLGNYLTLDAAGNDPRLKKAMNDYSTNIQKELDATEKEAVRQ